MQQCGVYSAIDSRGDSICYTPSGLLLIRSFESVYRRIHVYIASSTPPPALGTRRMSYQKRVRGCSCRRCSTSRPSHVTRWVICTCLCSRAGTRRERRIITISPAEGGAHTVPALRFACFVSKSLRIKGQGLRVRERSTRKLR